VACGKGELVAARDDVFSFGFRGRIINDEMRAIVAGLIFLCCGSLGCKPRLVAEAPYFTPSSTYRTAEAAAVYRALFDANIGTVKPAMLVIVDSTIAKSHWGDAELEQLKNDLEPEISEETILDFRSENSVSVKLTENFGYSIPVRFITRLQNDSIFGGHWMGKNPWRDFYVRYPGSQGVIHVSKVGFNRSHTEAMVEFDLGCDLLCGHGGIYTLVKVSGTWVVHMPKRMWVS
jgi:hypothetical protein